MYIVIMRFGMTIKEKVFSSKDAAEPFYDSLADSYRDMYEEGREPELFFIGIEL